MKKFLVTLTIKLIIISNWSRKTNWSIDKVRKECNVLSLWKSNTNWIVIDIIKRAVSSRGKINNVVIVTSFLGINPSANLIKITHKLTDQKSLIIEKSSKEKEKYFDLV